MTENSIVFSEKSGRTCVANGLCYDTSQTADLNIQFSPENKISKEEIEIHAKFFPDLKYDIIIGRPSIKKLALVLRFPSHFVESASGVKLDDMWLQTHGLYATAETTDANSNPEVPATNLKIPRPSAMRPCPISKDPDLDFVMPMIHGEEGSLKDKLTKLILEFKDIFRVKLREEDGCMRVPPMKIEVNKDLWETNRNRGPPRILNMQKEGDLKVAVDK